MSKTQSRSALDLVMDEAATLRAAGHTHMTHNVQGLVRGHYRVARSVHPKLAEWTEKEFVQMVEEELRNDE